jgi:ABC-type dipeptide/oligopeptide/nickel transport system permease component
MNISAGTITFGIIFLIVVVAGSIILQIFLSKNENKWPGLILPIIFFLLSLVAVFSVVSFTTGTTVDGVVIAETAQQINGAWSAAIVTFLHCNIPTAVLLAIYAACRGKHTQQRALEKMSVQDLQ